MTGYKYPVDASPQCCMQHRARVEEPAKVQQRRHACKPLLNHEVFGPRQHTVPSSMLR